jgi:riboflavin synthase
MRPPAADSTLAGPMFTGLITTVGAVLEANDIEGGRAFQVSSSFRALAQGESIACNGACLTVRKSDDGWFVVKAVGTTLDRTTMGSWKFGTKLNLERALAVGDRFGGHIVQGHVDGVGTIVGLQEDRSALLLDIEVPSEVEELLVPLGSITVDGVSLTVNALPRPGIMQVSIIEHTRQHTTLGALRAGDRVQLESDVLAKYVKRLTAPLLSQ